MINNQDRVEHWGSSTVVVFHLALQNLSQAEGFYRLSVYFHI